MLAHQVTSANKVSPCPHLRRRGRRSAAGQCRGAAPSPTTWSLAPCACATSAYRELRAVRAVWGESVRARAYSAVWRVEDLLLRQPVLDSPTIARELSIPPQNAVRVLQPLLDAGVLSEFTGHRRNRMWQAREVLDALDSFAARSGRRSTG